MGGQLTVESVVGKGSCFEFTIHIREGKPNTLVKKPDASTRLKGARRTATILLAEDNKVNQMLAVRTLEKGGYHVLVANNGVEAFRSLSSNR